MTAHIVHMHTCALLSLSLTGVCEWLSWQFAKLFVKSHYLLTNIYLFWPKSQGDNKVFLEWSGRQLVLCIYIGPSLEIWTFSNGKRSDAVASSRGKLFYHMSSELCLYFIKRYLHTVEYSPRNTNDTHSLVNLQTVRI